MNNHTQIFVNLPVKNLDRAIGFFTGLGLTLNPEYTDQNAACMVISEKIFVMLLTEEFFKTFAKKEIVNAAKSTEAIVALSMESREEVNEIADKALKTGGKISGDPMDHGWMYSRSFEDPDGHLWEVFYMDPQKK
ncbi:MAG: VOC family protein [Calditrichaceae bacterium]|nr:VOC family protein [Calditrichaceae bacterium]MBN2709755.1 VOC family protein [Calditrichaceae bacterium]RQV94949.1 MAG: glyoxalase/bleomycin resistance/extradiol dioxygenase family protein [Calditrichota bacterium]